MGNVDIFSLFGSHSEHLAQFLNAFMSVRMQNHRRLFIVSFVLKRDKLEGVF